MSPCVVDVCTHPLGWTVERLAAGGELLRDVPWSTVGVEQQHGSMAVQHRQHKQYTAEVLSMRAFMNSLRTFVSPGPDEAVLSRKMKRLARVEARMPDKHGGWQCFVQGMMEHTRSHLPSAACKLSFNTTKRSSESDGVRWKLMSLQQKEGFAKEARSAVAAKKKEKADDIRHLQDEVLLFQKRKQLEAEMDGVRYRASHMRLSDADIDQIQLLYSSTVSRKDIYGSWQPLGPSLAMCR